MKKIEPIQLLFTDDGETPNSLLPVLIYRLELKDIKENHGDFLIRRFQENGWTNNWRDTILSEDHYHSTTHEVLGFSKGKVSLKLGGKNGKKFQASAGDIIILPAGVAHKSLDKHSNYEVIGGYPEGRSWDLIYCEPEKYLRAKATIKNLPFPKTNPIFGLDGSLERLWK